MPSHEIPVWWLVTSDILKILAAFLSVLGTFVVAFLAIYGERLRKWMFPPDLTLELVNDGCPTPIDFNPPRYYYHICLRNKQKLSPAINCRVMLCGFSRKDANNKFPYVPVPFSLQFTWSPSEMPPTQRTISGEDKLDLGFISQSIKLVKNDQFATKPDYETKFSPQFYLTPSGNE
jgi:hypothetical protein